MHTDPVIMAGAVCNDLPYAQAYENALKIPHHSTASFKEEVTQASYKDIPLTYIFCERISLSTLRRSRGSLIRWRR